MRRAPGSSFSGPDGPVGAHLDSISVAVGKRHLAAPDELKLRQDRAGDSPRVDVVLSKAMSLRFNSLILSFRAQWVRVHALLSRYVQIDGCERSA